VKRIDCLRALAPRITDELVVIGVSWLNYEWRHLSDHEGNMFIGSLGHAAGVGTGIALSFPHRRVIVLESDGSTLMDLPCLAVIGTYRPENLTVFVFDDELYSGSGIDEPSATAFNTDLEAIARGAGIPQTSTVRELEHFREQAEITFARAGLRYVVAKVEQDEDARRLPRPRMDFLENKYRFVRYIERTEEIDILPSLH
jgi:thiamine pyrophosphate-dependent acetolactate synthase large subunit-like protein